jgi:hypothetical protein
LLDWNVFVVKLVDEPQWGNRFSIGTETLLAPLLCHGLK